MTLPLDMEGVRVAQGSRVLLSVDRLRAEAGVALGVAGPSGAGKSTLLHVLAGLLPAASGRVSWGDADIAGMTDGARTAFRGARMGLVFQDFLLFEELGALDNAAVAAGFGPAAARAAHRARAAERLRALGIDPDDPRPVSSHSGGERQRIAVARALAGDPDVLLADEPTASLHRAAADRLIEDLCRLVREAGTTLIAVSHDPALLGRMDRVVTVADGTLAGDGVRSAA